MAEITCGGSFSAGPPLEAHFGLGAETVVDVRVVWPSGRIQRREGVAVDQVLTLREPPVDDADTTPARAAFAFPNPFRSRTSLSLARSGAGGIVILDASGARVRRLDSGTCGRTEWDGRSDDGRRVAPGVYYIDTEEGSAQKTRPRVVLIR
jgi:hypothetical protein